MSQKLPFQKFSSQQIENLKKNLPKKFVIYVYGLGGTGKGSLTNSLSLNLEIPLLEASLFYRASTYIYTQLKLPFSKDNTDLVFDKMNIEIRNGRLYIMYAGVPIARNSLKNNFIDSHVNKYSKEPYLRQKTNDFVFELITKKLASACIVDARGSNPPFIQKAQTEKQFKVVRICLQAEFEEKVRRIYEDQLKQAKTANPYFDENSQEAQAFYQKARQTLEKRDKKDLETQQKMKIGVTSEDSGVIDTTDLSLEEVLQTALSFIYKKICDSYN